MILVLEVRGAQVSALGASSRRQFGPEGGVIGRAPTCDWVLPHAKVSARHAIVTFANGVFYLEDKSTNGVFVNQTKERLVRGRPHALQSGDRIFIDPYDIRVSVSGDAAVVGRGEADWDLDPFGTTGAAYPAASDPFAAAPFAAGRSAAGNAVRPDLGVSNEAAEDRELDPLKLIGGPAPVATPGRRPQARDLDAASPIAAHYKPPAIRTPPAPAVSLEIPEDYNPLDDSGAVAFTPQQLGSAPDPARPVDWHTPAATPQAPAEHETVGFDGAGNASEPVASIASEPVASIAFEPVASTAAEPVAGSEQPVAHTGSEPADPDLTVDGVFAESSEFASRVLPSTPEAAPEPMVAATAAPVLSQSDRRADSMTPRANARVSGDLAAVLAGAGLEGVQVTEELARDFGRILEVVVAGVMDVLRSRQQIKDEFRMRMTQFRPADNNPLKFSANVEDALHNLLVKRNAAYLQPVEAFEDAFDDVRWHQMAMLAGIRVAFDAMLVQFNPDRLQERFDRQLKKGSLLTVPAKLRYWDLYRDYCENLLKDSESTFSDLFGEAFAEAYEEQLARLKAEKIARRRATEPES